MHRYLVVAHQTVTNPLLFEKLKEIALQDPPAEFTLIVPATPVRNLLFRQRTGQDAEAVARELADKARSEFKKSFVNLVDARVGAESPRDAIDNELKANPGYKAVVLSTLIKGESRWLELEDLPKYIQTTYGLPVHLISALPGFFGAWSDSWRNNAYSFGSGNP